MATNNVTLGSGYIYVVELPATGVIPADSAIEIAGNQFGYTKGGATLAYETDFAEITDDNGQIKESFLNTDSATFKCGAFMGSAADIVKICPTATATTADGVTTVKLGGVSNDDNKKYIVRFKHKTEPLRVTIVGKNTDGFEFWLSKADFFEN